jgi:hypothetical protein
LPVKNKIIIVLILSIILFKQESPAQELITDRPDITESALTIPVSTFQIETGFIYQQNLENINGTSIKERTISIAGTLLRYGIISSVELRAGGEFLFNHMESGQVTETIEGLNGLVIGSKIQLLRDHAELPDAAIFFHFNLPAGNKKLKPEKVEPEILLAVSHSLVNPLSLSYNLGGTWESSDEIINCFYSSSLGIELSDKTGMFAEIFGDFSSSTSPSFNFDAGFVYLVLENLQLDISSGFNFDKPGENWFLGSGVSLRLPE